MVLYASQDYQKDIAKNNIYGVFMETIFAENANLNFIPLNLHCPCKKNGIY